MQSWEEHAENHDRFLKSGFNDRAMRQAQPTEDALPAEAAAKTPCQASARALAAGS